MQISKNTKMLSVVLILAAVGVVGLLSANHQANHYQTSLKHWHTAKAQLASSLQTNTFSDKMVVDALETDAQLAILQQRCSTEQSVLKQVAGGFGLPSLGTNPLGFLSSSFRREQAAHAIASKQLAAIANTVTQQAHQYVSFCQFYDSLIAAGQKYQAASEQLTHQLSYTGTSDTTGGTCASVGGCLPDDNIASWPAIAATKQQIATYYKTIIDYYSKHGCYLPNYQAACTADKNTYQAYLAIFQPYIDAIAAKNKAVANVQSVKLQSFTFTTPASIAGYKKVNPNLDPNDPSFSSKTWRMSMQAIEAKLIANGKQLAAL